MKQKLPIEAFINALLPLALILGLVLILGLDVESVERSQELENPLEQWLKPIVGYLAAAAEIAAAIVIGSAVFRGIATYVQRLVIQGRQPGNIIETIRLQLGEVLILGLEFTVASDILRTAVAPTRQDILNLGAIVLLRTLLNYFLELEIKQGEEARLEERRQDVAETAE
ncbi:DUF1622 domain-containing protein [Oscillatoria sp. FACHB-1407]|uniref:DUF1622 domain-containing protein n=1 Tax=Oscillatoria sp. FACHB-1407 TaxID=2692847 RepID=UPI0016866FD9|nr:DUF1622 domain-containing protein [Oscillatoria sp. FACHB-1407]MBD2461454.1 DUF1622 domain-containing protein [Oscillatoria sp. FACHB-1407]